jgi:plastocyanin
MGRSRSWPRLARSFLPALLIALLVVGVGFALASRSAAASTAAATVNIAIGDNNFTPEAVTVNVGDTVVWTNSGKVAHDVTALNGGAFTSPRNLAPGATFSYTATTAGTFAYVCTIHLNQNGSLTVQAPAAVPVAAPRTGGGGMAGGVTSQWQQLAGIGALLVLGIGALVALRLRRAV